MAIKSRCYFRPTIKLNYTSLLTNYSIWEIPSSTKQTYYWSQLCIWKEKPKITPLRHRLTGKLTLLRLCCLMTESYNQYARIYCATEERPVKSECIAVERSICILLFLCYFSGFHCSNELRRVIMSVDKAGLIIDWGSNQLRLYRTIRYSKLTLYLSLLFEKYKWVINDSVSWMLWKCVSSMVLISHSRTFKARTLLISIDRNRID